MGITAYFAPCLAMAATSEAMLVQTPPMGWMSWEIFRCDIDCGKHSPEVCIGEELYKTSAAAMVEHGFLAAGYDTIHIDDCWEGRQPPRDGSGRLYPNASRFPSGFGGPHGLAAYCHARGVKLGLYSDEGSLTCGQYPGSKGHEQADAASLASWGVDYLKLDGCYEALADYKRGYSAMGAALRASGRAIVYSCSWPAYLGDDEAAKPYADVAAAGCNLWRNWHDIQCNWPSLSSIIDHWGDYSDVLQAAAGPGHWNDPDMLLIGARDATGAACLTLAEERTQMALWSLWAAPLIMGNDVRSVRNASKRILLNARAVAIDQDTLGQPGRRLSASASSPLQIWARNLSNGDVAVGIYNKGAEHAVEPGRPPASDATLPCVVWQRINRLPAGDESFANSGIMDFDQFQNKSVSQAMDACCTKLECVGISHRSSQRGGQIASAEDTNGSPHPSRQVYLRPSQIREKVVVDVAIPLEVLGFLGRQVRVIDVWTGQKVGNFEDHLVVDRIGVHDTAFLRISTIRIEQLQQSEFA